MSAVALAQVLIGGLQTGGIYALMALSYYVILSATGILNFAQGEWMMLAAVFGVVLLNLCLLLPGLILGWYLRQRLVSPAQDPSGLPLPMAVWRVDMVVLVVLGMMLAPVALGHWRLGKIEGMALIVGYAAYLIAATALGVRW